MPGSHPLLSVPRSTLKTMTDWQDLFTHSPTRLPARADHMTAAYPFVPPGSPAAVVSDPWQKWWTYARIAARVAYYNPSAPPRCIEVYGPVLDPGEIAILNARATYSRFYGDNGSYDHSDMFVVGHPTLMIGMLAGNAILNARRKAKARDAATPRWRSQQPAQVIVTNLRLLCHLTASGWLSFYYDAASEFYPDLQAWTLTVGFGDQCAPLRITGPPVPALSLWAAIGIEGQRWHTDPRLSPLLT
jgi:hypothetical protein